MTHTKKYSNALFADCRLQFSCCVNTVFQSQSLLYQKPNKTPQKPTGLGCRSSVDYGRPLQRLNHMCCALWVCIESEMTDSLLSYLRRFVLLAHFPFILTSSTATAPHKYMAPTLLLTEKSRTFPGLSRTSMKNFPWPFWSPRMFKYKEKTPLICLQYSECSPLQKIQHEAKCGR